MLLDLSLKVLRLVLEKEEKKTSLPYRENVILPLLKQKEKQHCLYRLDTVHHFKINRKQWSQLDQ